MSLITNFGELAAFAGEAAAGLICRSLESAIHAVHPSRCIPEYLATDAGRKFVSFLSGADIICAGGGKASAQMASALKASGIPLGRGQINCNTEGNVGDVILRKCSHPFPDETTVENTNECVEMLLDSSEATRIIFLLSGGASSMLSAPIDFVGLERKRAVSERMMLAGASISEINCVRRHLSRIKGGKLSRLCHPRGITSLIISDVMGNSLEDIGSGPTSPDYTTSSDAIALMRRYGAIEFLEGLEETLLSGRYETVKPGDQSLDMTTNTIIADNSAAVASAVAAASYEGYKALAFPGKLVGDVDYEAARFVGNARASLKGPGLYVGGGEVRVRVTRKGKGGRCQHFALSCAALLREGEFVAAFATDGRDGNTSAAGGLSSANGDSSTFLRNFDTGTYFASNHTTINTGDTGTNVADIYLYFKA